MKSYTQMLCNLKNKPWAAVGDFEGIEDGWELIFKLDIDDGTDDCDNLSIRDSCCWGCSFSGGLRIGAHKF
jgi:hypothetical protein